MAINYAEWRSGLVVDVSRYQRRIRAGILRVNGVRMVIGKLGQGTSLDSRFEQHYNECKQDGMPISAYFWPDPISPARPQAEFLLRQVDRFPAILAIADDFEQWWAAWGPWTEAVAKRLAWAAVKALDPARISDHYQEFAEFIQARTSTPQIAYTSYNFVKAHAPGMADWLARWPLWNAAYIWGGSRVQLTWDELKENWMPRPGATPLVPPGAGRIVGWQYTGDKLMLPGMYADEAGTELSPADVSIFDPAWLDLITSGKEPEKPQPEPQPGPEPMPSKALLRGTVVGTPFINVRSGPGTKYADIGDLPAGTQVNILALDGQDVWAEIEPGKWACVRTGLKELIKVRPEQDQE